MMSSDVLSWSSTRLAAAVRAGELRAEDVTRASLDAIAEKDAGVGAFLHVARDSALAQAREIDLARTRGERLGALAGVPVAVKDALVTKDMPTTAGSRILCRPPSGEVARPEHAWVSPYDATVVERLRAAGAVIVGKANMDEFAMGSSNERSAFFPTKNPLDPARVPGGSSGGSAAAVAAGMAPLAIGSDTGGSVRQPAAFTGTVGFKPTYGRVSRFGLIAFASSLDQIGGFARDVDGAAHLYQAIAGHDLHDATSLAIDVPELGSAPASLEGLRLGVPEEYVGEGLEAGVRRAFDRALDRARQSGASITPIRLPHTRYAVSTYYVIATAEASSNLARFDGVRYGGRARGDSISEMYRRTRASGFGPEVKRRILLGTFVLSAGYYDAYYLRAQRARTLLARDFEEAFRSVDAIVTPTAPTVAFKLGAKTSDPLAMYLADVFTLPASLAGLPGLSLPCGRALPPDEPTGTPMPVGLQILGPPLEDARVLQVGRAFEALGLAEAAA